MNSEIIKAKDRDAILQALRAGVVPRLGLPHVQVGRSREVEQMVKDVERIREGGSSIRLVIGEYGSGKTFFLNLTRLIALESKLVVIHADLAPDRRLHATGGQARSLYAELVRNLSTRTKPDGGALASILERFILDATRLATSSHRSVVDVIHERLAPLEEFVAGFDFAAVVTHYFEAFEQANEEKKTAALRWLRGEYAVKTEARQALGVRTIIDDAGVYDALKLLSRFVHIAGYDGLLIVLDEMVNLYKLTSAQARNANYEQLLRILNDVLQGSASHVGFIFGGTPEFLMDTRRGLYSYEALRSRLAENSFAKQGLVDLSGPVLRLQNLTPEELYVLLGKLRHIHASGDPTKYAVPDQALTAFMARCSQKLGEAYFRTPRNTIKAFIDLLSVLEQNAESRWHDLLDTVEVAADRVALSPSESDENATETAPEEHVSSPSASERDDDFASFRV